MLHPHFGAKTTTRSEVKMKPALIKRKLIELYANSKRSSSIYRTGIASLDEMLKDDPFGAGSVWEICGISAIGKTQLCLTVVLNFAQRFDNTVLFIDTKLDFSGTRLMQMMRGHQTANSEYGELLRQILVERPMSLSGVLNTLNQLLGRLEAKDEAASNIKLVVIDAVSAVWFMNRVHKDRGCHQLSMLSQLIWRLARQFHLAFLISNLSIPRAVAEEKALLYTQSDSEDGEETPYADDKAAPTDPDESDNHQVLGRIWSSVPQIRLILQRTKEETAETDANNADSLRTIKVVKSCFTATGHSCNIRITDEGVTSA